MLVREDLTHIVGTFGNSPYHFPDCNAGVLFPMVHGAAVLQQSNSSGQGIPHHLVQGILCLVS